MRKAAAFVALVVLGWTVWDTGADPVRLAHGLPWIADFVRRMLPPDLAVLPATLLGAVKTVEIALLGTAVAAALALPLGFVSARNVAPPAVFYPARAVLNLFRSVDTLVYALIFVAAVGLGPFPGVLAVVAYTTTSLAKLPAPGNGKCAPQIAILSDMTRSSSLRRVSTASGPSWS